MKKPTKIISYGRQSIDQSDIDEVIKVLQSDFLTQGSCVEIFENDLKSFFGSKYACVVSNGTAALHLTAVALGWAENDIIITSPLTFVASANCISYVNAVPAFVDIDPLTYTIDTDLLDQKVTQLRSEGKKVKAIIAVDFAGHPCNWKELKRIAMKNDLILINDNCHALGTKYFNDQQYAVKYADIVIQSFHPVKNITTGEGGAIITNDKKLFEKVKVLRTHGIVKNELYNEDPWFYEMNYLGYNYRITDFQCALGSNQLKKLASFISARNKIAEYYDEYFQNESKIKIPNRSSNIRHAFHLYPIQINFKKIKINKRDLFLKMRNLGFLLQVHYIPVHLQPYYKNKFGFKKGDFKKSESFYESEVSLPIFPNLKKIDQKRFIESILGILNE